MVSTPTGFVRLNSDVFAFGNPGSAGTGGVLWDCFGKWISDFAHHIGFTISFVAELWGLRECLMLARWLDVSKIVIEIDVKSIVDLLNCEGDHGFQFHPCSVIFSDYRTLIQLFEVTLFQHTHREGNYCADLLAKAGNSSSTPFSVFYVPLLLL